MRTVQCAQYNAQSKAAKDIVSSMVLYYLGVIVLLGASGISSGPAGGALW